MEALGRFVRGFGRFWYDFIVGDDYKIAVAVVVVLGLGAVLVATIEASGPVLMIGLAALLLAGFTAAMAIDVGGARRRQG